MAETELNLDEIASLHAIEESGSVLVEGIENSARWVAFDVGFGLD